jgi:retron-type reverse transcriptase
MKTYFTFENLHQAYINCRKSKTQTFYCKQFSYDLEDNLFRLNKQLGNRTYKPMRSIAFIVQQPKIREIFAADFRDRVIHHLLYNYLAPIFERIFIYDSWACRKDKGTHGAMLRVQEFAVRLERETALGAGYYLKMDIKSFFTSIDKDILYALIAKKVKSGEILWLTRVIIFHDSARDIPPRIQSQQSLFDRLPPDKSLFTAPLGKGLPIGNLTSQFFANVYLNELDQFVKHELKAKYYVRYVDDFLILAQDRAQLEAYRSAITEFVTHKLALTVHPNKVFIRSISSGIDFVGYVVRPDYILIRKRVVANWRRHLELAEEENRERVSASYRAHAMWANSYTLTKKMSARVTTNGYNKN